jgi:lipoyl(octanoyl) transferase
MNDSDMRTVEIFVCHLGTVPYREGLSIQERARAVRQADEIPDTLLLLEHPPVYTRGRRSLDGELSLGEDFYRAHGIEVVGTDRGGRVTYHGPGQLVGYPIMRVSDIGRHLRAIEGAIVAALAEEGIEARSRCGEGPDFTGVWVQDRKIASIGVHVSRGVSTHGFAVNLTNDLTPFDWIVPCGLSGVRMTSVAQELAGAHEIDEQRFRDRVADRFAAAHGRIAVSVTARDLGVQTTAIAA